MNRIHIRTEQVALDAQCVALGACGKLCLLVRDLAAQTVGVIRKQTQKILTFHAHTLNLVALGVERVEHFGKALFFTDRHRAAVLTNVHKREIFRFILRVDDNMRRAGNVFRRLHQRRHVHLRTAALRGRHAFHIYLMPQPRVVFDFARNDRRNALQNRHQRFGKLHITR